MYPCPICFVINGKSSDMVNRGPDLKNLIEGDGGIVGSGLWLSGWVIASCSLSLFHLYTTFQFSSRKIKSSSVLRRIKMKYDEHFKCV